MGTLGGYIWAYGYRTICNMHHVLDTLETITSQGTSKTDHQKTPVTNGSTGIYPRRVRDADESKNTKREDVVELQSR